MKVGNANEYFRKLRTKFSFFEEMTKIPHGSGNEKEISDDRCSTVWKHIDGERTIYDIAKIMATIYKEDLNKELYRLVTYLKYLSKRGWIKFKEYEI